MSAGNALGHMSWLSASTTPLTTADGRPVYHWKFNPVADATMWRAWAKHFRSQYIDDTDIDDLKAGTTYEESKASYLLGMIFPDEEEKPGPSIRSGDFCEVLVADLLESNFGYYVPRTRFQNKIIRNESPKGSDVIGIKVELQGTTSPNDELAIYEVKGRISGKLGDDKSRLQDAIDGSCKDYKRVAESLNATKRRLLELGRTSEMMLVQRFQNAEDRPYKYQPGAAAVLSTACWSANQMSVTTCVAHPHAGVVHLVVIEADDFSKVAKDLYRMAADEA